MGWLLLIGLAGLAFMATRDNTEGETGGAAWRETLLEPPNAASPATADFVIDLVADGSGSVKWTVSGGNPPIQASGESLDRDDAIADAYAVIEKHRGKLPAPVNRHGLRVSADCGHVTVQNLEAWLTWAAPAVDVVAGELDAQKRLTGGQLMRGVWARAFPECKDASPQIRAQSWQRVAKQVQRVVDKLLAGDFIDVHPVGRVLAAKIVGMNPPKVPGRAFFHTAKNGTKFAVVVDPVETAVGKRWRWRIWQGHVGGEPRQTGDEGTEAAASNAARTYIDELKGHGVSFN